MNSFPALNHPSVFMFHRVLLFTLIIAPSLHAAIRHVTIAFTWPCPSVSVRLVHPVHDFHLSDLKSPIFDLKSTSVAPMPSHASQGELPRQGNMQKMHIPGADKPVVLYDLDVIISVGYRVNSKRGTQFRIWAMPNPPSQT